MIDIYVIGVEITGFTFELLELLVEISLEILVEIPAVDLLIDPKRFLSSSERICLLEVVVIAIFDVFVRFAAEIAPNLNNEAMKNTKITLSIISFFIFFLLFTVLATIYIIPLIVFIFC